MSNDLTTQADNMFSELGIEVRTDATDTALDSAYIPAMRLIIKSSPLTDSGFPVNHFGIAYTSDDVQDAGSHVDGYLINFREKAVSGLQDGNIKVVYDKTNPDYKTIADQVGVANSGCAAGPEVLLYIPERDEFVTFHFGSKSLGYAWNGAAKFVAKGIRVTFSPKHVKEVTKPFFVAQIHEAAVKIPFMSIASEALISKMKNVNEKFITAKPFDKAAAAIAARAESR